MNQKETSTTNKIHDNAKSHVVSSQNYDSVMESLKIEALEQTGLKKNFPAKKKGKFYLGSKGTENMLNDLIEAAEEELKGEPDGRNTSVEQTENQV